MSCNSRSTFQSNADLFLPKRYSHLDVCSFIPSLTLSQLLRWLSGCFFLLLYQPWEGCRCNDCRLQTSPLSARHLTSYLICVLAVCLSGRRDRYVLGSAVTSTQSALTLVLLSPEPVCSGSFRIRTFQHYLQNMIEKKKLYDMYIHEMYESFWRKTWHWLFAINDLTAEVVQCSFVLWYNIFLNPWTCPLLKYKPNYWHIFMKLYSCRGYYKNITQKIGREI